MNDGVVLLKKMLDDEKVASEDLKAELRTEKENSKTLISAQCTIDELKKEATQKDDLIAQLEGAMKKSDSELRAQLRQREGEFKSQMNLIMKDNAVVLKRCRELEAAVGELTTALNVAVKSREAQKILVENGNQEILRLKQEHEVDIALRQDTKEQTDVLLKEKDAKYEQLRNENDTLLKEAVDNRNRITDMETGLQSVKKDLAQAQ